MPREIGMSRPELDIIALRREFHRHAEPGWCEVGTTAAVVEALKSLGWAVRFGPDVVDAEARMGLPPDDVMAEFHDRAIGNGADRDVAGRLRNGFTGVVGSLKGERPGPTIAVRVDMDANLGDEAADQAHLPARLGFRSRHDGVLHNCGHDGHTAIGLGLAAALSGAGADLGGEVRLIFQPAEEGLRGARSMVAANVLDGVDLFFGFHIGVQALSPGELIAGYRNILASAKFDTSFTGQSAHAAISPHVGRNAILAAAIATQGLLSLPRHGDGETRINVGRILGGESRNTIPSSARIEAEIRADTTEILDAMQQQAERVVRGAAQGQDVEVSIDYLGRSCAGNSDTDLTQFVADTARHLDQVSSIRLSEDFKGSDDAAEMMSAVQQQGGKAVYMGFGSEMAAVHHNPSFDFGEKVLPFGVRVLERLIFEAGNIGA
jgi:aminobenzoyl-glutamate utilization protein A